MKYCFAFSSCFAFSYETATLNRNAGYGLCSYADRKRSAATRVLAAHERALRRLERLLRRAQRLVGRRFLGGERRARRRPGRAATRTMRRPGRGRGAAGSISSSAIRRHNPDRDQDPPSRAPPPSAIAEAHRTASRSYHSSRGIRDCGSVAPHSRSLRAFTGRQPPPDRGQLRHCRHCHRTPSVPRPPRRPRWRPRRRRRWLAPACRSASARSTDVDREPMHRGSYGGSSRREQRRYPVRSPTTVGAFLRRFEACGVDIRGAVRLHRSSRTRSADEWLGAALSQDATDGCDRAATRRRRHPLSPRGAGATAYDDRPHQPRYTVP